VRVTHFVPDVGRAILPAAAFHAALSGHTLLFAVFKRRLKAGCSQDWLPHKFCGIRSAISAIVSQLLSKRFLDHDQFSHP
jgi:hypothetical protein